MPFSRTVNFDDPRMKALCLDALRNERGEKVVSVQEPTRSHKQNALYWVDVVEPLSEWLTASEGQRWTKEDVHEFMKANFLPLREFVDPRTGDLLMIPQSTTKLNKSDFSVLIEKGLFAIGDIDCTTSGPRPHEANTHRERRRFFWLRPSMFRRDCPWLKGNIAAFTEKTMGQTTIEWTRTYHADGTFSPGFSINPIRARRRGLAIMKGGYGSGIGHYCEKISSGCANCYASTSQPRFGMPEFPGAKATDPEVELFFDDSRLLEVLRRRKPTRWFWCDQTDIFGRWVRDEWIHKCFAVMALTPWHTHQILTKRIERAEDYLAHFEARMRCWCEAAESMRKEVPESIVRGIFREREEQFDEERIGTVLYEQPDSETDSGHRPLRNVWLGTSVENQKLADERIPHLLRCPAAVRFLSVEPMLGPVDLGPVIGEPQWVHPERNDDGRRACERIGVGIGDELLRANVAGWIQPPGFVGQVRWQNGRLVVWRAERVRVTGWYEPQYGDCDRGGVCCDHGMTNIVCGQLSTGSTIGDPELVFPIAKAPPRTIDWVIDGGESGPGARAYRIEWSVALQRQCDVAGVAYFRKQVGSRPTVNDLTHWRCPVEHLPDGGYLLKLKDKKGGDQNEWPPELRVRQMPVPAGTEATR